VDPTRRLYLDDDECMRVEAICLALEDGAIACDRTCFYRSENKGRINKRLYVRPRGCA